MRTTSVGVAIAGAVLLLVGIIMIPLPGPGFLVAGFGAVALVVGIVSSITAKPGNGRRADEFSR